jgi:hypothetical protein
MNEKQVKLLRYFVKQSGDIKMAALIKSRWPSFDHKKKGQLTGWLKRVVVTLMSIKEEQKRKTVARNMAVVKGFSL